MKFAKLKSSPRLQRVLGVLRDGREHTTRDIVVDAHVCAVNSCIAELRANGFDIACRHGVDGRGERVWAYRLVEPRAARRGGRMSESFFQRWYTTTENPADERGDRRLRAPAPGSGARRRSCAVERDEIPRRRRPRRQESSCRTTRRSCPPSPRRCGPGRARRELGHRLGGAAPQGRRPGGGGGPGRRPDGPQLPAGCGDPRGWRPRVGVTEGALRKWVGAGPPRPRPRGTA